MPSSRAKLSEFYAKGSRDTRNTGRPWQRAAFIAEKRRSSQLVYHVSSQLIPSINYANGVWCLAACIETVCVLGRIRTFKSVRDEIERIFGNR